MSAIAMNKEKFNDLLGSTLRRRRVVLGWTLEEVSKRSSLNVSKVTLSSIERGQQKLSAFQLFLLCETLGVTFDNLKSEISNNNSPDLVFVPEGSNGDYTFLQIK